MTSLVIVVLTYTPELTTNNELFNNSNTYEDKKDDQDYLSLTKTHVGISILIKLYLKLYLDIVLRGFGVDRFDLVILFYNLEIPISGKRF